MAITYTTDAEAHAGRMAKVASYLTANVLSADGKFTCRWASECRASHAGAFHEAQLHHIGKHYELRRNGKPFRIVVVGQEYGHANDEGTTYTDLDARYGMIMDSGLNRRFRAEDGPPRNPHMRGTTSLLRLLFGVGLGHDHGGEFIPIDGRKTHVFDAASIVNYLMCSATPEGSRQGRSTRVMRENCAGHFLSVIDALEPTILIAQGRQVRQWLEDIYNVGWISTLGTVGIAVDAGHPFVVIALNHPSARGYDGWGGIAPSLYLEEVVRPSVEEAIGYARRGIPSFDEFERSRINLVEGLLRSVGKSSS